MKVIGIVAEYNPFHRGHEYQIQKAKELTGADHVVVVMSGNYVQRGTPAILDKFTRTKAALSSGADLVFELPVLWSSSSAEYFASAAVTLLDKLGIVDYLSFGSETTDISLMEQVALLLNHETPAYRAHLDRELKSGLTFPAAKANAAALCLGLNDTETSSTAQILSSPNSILAVEYIRELKRRKSAIQICPVLRSGSGYHDDAISSSYSSATAIRKLLLNKEVSDSRERILRSCVPPVSAELLVQTSSLHMTENDFSALLLARLIQLSADELAEFADCSTELANRIKHLLPQFSSFASFTALVKSRNTTYSRISRVLLHIALNIKQNNYSRGRDLDYIPYLRLLGLRRKSSFLLKERTDYSIPLLQKPSQIDRIPRSGRWMYELDWHSSDLYYGLSGMKSQTHSLTESQCQLITL